MNTLASRTHTTAAYFADPRLVQAQRTSSNKHSARVDFQDSHGKNYQTFGDALLGPLEGYQKGFGVDLDGDGKFHHEKDGFLSLNLGGRNGLENITRTNDMLKAFSGNFDANGDGKLSSQELHQGNQYAQRAAQMDLDRDGTLSRFELQTAGAKVVKHDTKLPYISSSPATYQVSLPGFPAEKPSYHLPQGPVYGQPSHSPFFGSFLHNIFSVFSGFGTFGGFSGFAQTGPVPVAMTAEGRSFAFAQTPVNGNEMMLQGPSSLGLSGNLSSRGGW